MGNNEILTKYVAKFVAHLFRAGMEEVVISPGSRSTPLAILCCHHPQLKTFVHIDERSAGFFALGRARATGKPVGLVCTSGSAAANYYPAIVEAKQSRVPLVVLTADRPHELRDVGAPQAMDQNEMYASYTKWYHDTALPEDCQMMLNYIGKVAMRAVTTANLVPKGVVQINLPFREPLMPDLSNANLWNEVLNGEIEKQRPSIIKGCSTFSMDQLMDLVRLIKQSPKGLIVCGPEMEFHYEKQILALSHILHVPVFVDPLSQMRNITDAHFIHSYDALLRSPLVKEKLRPDWIIRFGAQPVSKVLSQFLETTGFLAIVDRGDGWRDPSHHVDQFYYGDEASFCQTMMDALEQMSVHHENVYLKTWQKIHKEVEKVYKEQPQVFEALEGKVIFPILSHIGNENAMMVANSMPIREMDSFYISGEACGAVYANRGVNGIDGLVSTAIGLAQSYKELTLMIGDLAFFHDLSALLLLKRTGCNLKIILVNNYGGGIFSFLPQAKDETYFEAVFGTPIDLDFEKAAALYELPYERVGLVDANNGISRLYQKEGSALLEVVSDRKKNVQAHQMLWKMICEKIEPLVLQMEARA